MVIFQTPVHFVFKRNDVSPETDLKEKHYLQFALKKGVGTDQLH